MTKYEGLFILNLAGTEEGVKDAIDRISSVIGENGGKIETVQKMDKRAFTRVTEKTVPSGFYVNVIFEAPPTAIPQLAYVGPGSHSVPVTQRLFGFQVSEAQVSP